MTEILATMLLGAAPVVELRGAIPYAVFRYGFSPEKAYVWSVLGNLLPAFSLLALGPVVRLLSSKWKVADTFFSWLFARTRARNEKKFERFASFALVLLVAVPLPMTGAWTGSAAAFVFGIPFKKAFPLIALGVVLAGMAVSVLTFGIQEFI